jgi:hypothetical protein
MGNPKSEIRGPKSEDLKLNHNHGWTRRTRMGGTNRKTEGRPSDAEAGELNTKGGIRLPEPTSV